MIKNLKLTLILAFIASVSVVSAAGLYYSPFTPYLIGAQGQKTKKAQEEAKKREEAMQKVKDNVVLVEGIPRREGERVEVGSGLMCRSADGRVLVSTAAHVVYGKPRVVFIIFKDGKPIQFEVVSGDVIINPNYKGDPSSGNTPADTALIDVNEEDLKKYGIDLKNLPLCSGKIIPKKGDELTIIGYSTDPSKQEIEAKFGVVSGKLLHEAFQNAQTKKRVDAYIIECRALNSNSGAPVVDKDGNVVGVCAAVATKTGVKMTFVAPISNIEELLKK